MEDVASGWGRIYSVLHKQAMHSATTLGVRQRDTSTRVDETFLENNVHDARSRPDYANLKLNVGSLAFSLLHAAKRRWTCLPSGVSERNNCVHELVRHAPSDPHVQHRAQFIVGAWLCAGSVVVFRNAGTIIAINKISSLGERRGA